MGSGGGIRRAINARSRMRGVDATNFSKAGHCPTPHGFSSHGNAGEGAIVENCTPDSDSSLRSVPEGVGSQPISTASAEEFVRLFSRSQVRILRFIHTLVPNLVEAEDILQETSVILWKKWPEFQHDRDFVKWACGIARFEVFRMLRQRKRNGLYLSEVVLNQIADIAVAEACAVGRLEASETALEMCLEKLRDSDRRLLALKYRHNLTVQQIADQCQKPKSSVHDLLARIRSRLSRCVRMRLEP